jgi:hypothetical protein
MNDTANAVEEKTLAEDLGEALDAALEEEPTEEVEEAEEEVEEASEEVEEVEVEEEPEDVAEDEEDEPLEPPQHWAAKHKEVFSSLDREGQEFLLERHKDMEGDYTRKMQEIAPLRKKYDSLEDVFGPHRQELAILGLDEVSAVRQLLAIREQLKTDPQATLMSLAQEFGVDFTQSEDDTDPAVLSLRNELNQIKTQQAQKDLEAQQQSQNTLIQQVEDFRTATDESGNLKHPLFEELRDDMGKLIEVGFAADLDDAYSQALARRSPESSNQPAKKEDVKEERKEKVRKAKKAAAGVKSTGAAIKSDSLTLREELEAQFANQE